MAERDAIRQRAEHALRIPDLEWAHDLVHGLARDVLELTAADLVVLRVGPIGTAVGPFVGRSEAISWLESIGFNADGEGAVWKLYPLREPGNPALKRSLARWSTSRGQAIG